MPAIVLQAEGLTKRFGQLVAIDDLSLVVYGGEVFGFLGPNGAGKTTAINMMCGLLEPDSGRVTVLGEQITGGRASVRARVGVCPQDIVLWERLTCLEQLQFMGEMYGLSRRLARERSERLLEELDLVEKRRHQARTLSGGMQRRLNLAMALVHDPQIVVLDEPEAGLDPQSRLRVRSYIQSLARRKTVILTTHNMDEAERLADRVAIIDHGRLLVLDTPQVLKNTVGEGDVLEVELQGERQPGDLVRLEAALDKVNGESLLSADGRLLTLRALNVVASLPAVVAGLEAAGLRLGEVRVRQNTLEDVFIQLTGRRLRE